MDNENNKETSLISSQRKEEITQYANEWKAAKNKKDKLTITNKVKKLYSADSVEYDYFTKLKIVTADDSKTSNKSPANYTSPEGIDRKEFGDVCSEYLKKYLYSRDEYNSEGIFFLDKNYNLPKSFWVRMQTQVLPCVEKDGLPQQRAWKLAIVCIQRHEDEFISRLQNTNFADLNHVANSIIQFLNKHLVTTYKEVVEKARLKRIKEQEAKQSEAAGVFDFTEEKVTKSRIQKRTKSKINTEGML